MEGVEIVHVGHVPFRPETGTPYHLSVALARHLPLTYLNPPLSLSQWAGLRTKYRGEGEGVKVHSVVLPGALRFLPRKWRKKPLRWLTMPVMVARLRHLRRKKVILWVSNSESALWLHRKLRPELTCYHRLDDFGAMDPQLEPLERALEQIADLIFVVSPHLIPQHQARGRAAHLLPNAVNTKLFAQATEPTTAVPADLLALPTPRIGFVGTLTPKWIDFEMMFEAAERRPNWSFVMIGPKVSWEPARLPTNFHLLGARPYHQLPAYLKGLDVCLVPFKDNAITHGASPLKLYEYLAAGRAIVSTPVPDLPAFEEVVWCARTSEELLSAIEQALPSAHDPQQQRRRMEYVQPHSWQARAETVISLIRSRLSSGEASRWSLSAHPVQ